MRALALRGAFARLELAIALVVVCALTACAAVGVPAPKTTQDAVAYGYGVVAAARATNTELVSAGTITPQRAREVRDIENAVRGGLDAAASSLAAGNESRAEMELAVVRSLLDQLDTFVKARK